MSIEPAPEVWVHGLVPLPGARVSEHTLLALLKVPLVGIGVGADLSISLEPWKRLSAERLGLSGTQAAACMRLCHTLSRAACTHPMPRDDAIRVPFGVLLCLLWVQWAQGELGEGCATNLLRSQAASGEPMPSPQQPPTAAACARVVDGGTVPCPRTLAVHARLYNTQLSRERRRLLQRSLPALLQLAGAGAERLYATELDRMSLLLRPERTAAERLASRGLPSSSLSAALGLWADAPRSAVPVAAVLAGLEAALIEVVAPPPLPKAAAGGVPAVPSTPVSARSAAASTHTPSSLLATPSTPQTGPPPRVTVNDDTRDPPMEGTLGPCDEGGPSSQGAGAVRLQGAKRRTLVLRSADLCGGSLQLIDCHSCYIYMLCPARTVEVLGCVGCTVFLGAVEQLVSISHCERVRLLATGKGLRLSNCMNVSLSLCVNSPPLVSGENHRVSFAPFSAVYSRLDEHMQAAQLSATLPSNFWADPVTPAGPLTLGIGAVNAREIAEGAAVGEAIAKGEFGPGSQSFKSPTKPSSPSRGEREVACSLLPPSKFMPFHVPMDMCAEVAEGRTVPSHCELPRAYADAIAGHINRIDAYAEQVEALEGPAKEELQAVLQAGFKEWLVASGNMQQVLDLMAKPEW